MSVAPAPAIGREVVVQSGPLAMPADRCRIVHRLMARSRALDERLIKMSKSGQSHFWVGGPGEEGLNVPLGLLVRKGRGPAFDYLHLHYRSAATLLAMGAPVLDVVRQAAMRATDPYSMGRNFVGHFAVRDWNVVPVSSVIANQFAIAPGTALVQKRLVGGEGVSIVVGGEAGTSEGDFETGLNWSTRPKQELPVLFLVTDNGYGISTPTNTQFSASRIVDRAKAHDVPAERVDGNDPIASWEAIKRALDYCRRERGPYLLHASVSRLHGHSSSSGALRVSGEPDPIERLESLMLGAGAANESELQEVHDEEREGVERAVAVAMAEPAPTRSDLYRHVYAPSAVDRASPVDCLGPSS